MRVQKPREIAWCVLQNRTASRTYTELALEELLHRHPLSAPDRRLAQELAYGVARWQLTLDHLITAKAERPPKPGVLNLLRLGLYQLFWLDRIPPHAAVHETVELARAVGHASQAGFINAILRAFLRERAGVEQLLIQWQRSSPALGFSHPEWLVERWEHRWGREQTLRLLQWNNLPPPLYARVNTLRTSPGSLLERWRLVENVEYDLFQRDWAGQGVIYRIKSSPPVRSWKSFLEGHFYLQDPGTLLAVHCLDPHAGETILDLCAAPGGKTTYIAQRMNDTGRIYAQDISTVRLQLVEENCARLGVSMVQTVLLPGLKADAPEFSIRASLLPELELPVSAPAPAARPAAGPGAPPLDRLPELMDRVLVDAPCSNTGVTRRRVDLRWRLRPEELHRLAKEQTGLLQKAAAFLKPGGVLVYSTCSLEPEENEQVVEAFVSNDRSFRLETSRLVTPFEHEVDGAFVARLIKEG